MRSCEYVKVPAAEKRRTDIVRLRCVVFRHNRAIIPHDSPDLELADFVSITFEMQKKDEKFDRVTQHTTGHIIMCPVRLWAAIIKRIRSYIHALTTIPQSQLSGASTKLNTSRAKTSSIPSITQQTPSATLTSELRRGTLAPVPVDRGGGECYGHGPRRCPPFRIMMIGRWSSDAFLQYICKQVDQFSHNISTCMNKHMHFRHIPIAD
jgi:hypothetical protein